MCGIVGYTGEASATPILVEGLTRMEYRGYDSAGVAVEQDGGIQVITRKGKVAELAHTLGHFEMTGTCGIGHTRWATHGKPSEANAHPHTSCSGRHRRGAQRHHRELRRAARGARRSAGTSSPARPTPRWWRTCVEESCHRMLAEGTGDLRAAVRRGGRAAASGPTRLAVMAACRARHDHRRPQGLAPSWWAAARPGSYVASDIIAMIDATRDVVVLADGQMATPAPRWHRRTTTTAGDPIQARRHPCRLGSRRRREGRLPRLHAEGDSRAATRHPRHPGRAAWLPARWSIDELDMTPAELNLVDRVYIIALRHLLPCGPHRQEPHRELGAHPLRGGGRQRVPLPQSHHHAHDAGAWPYRSRARRPTPWPPSATPA